jgi:hypothetical protein
MADFDALRAAVRPGDAVVARFPGIVCLAGAGSPAAAAHVPALLDLCRDAAGPAPGRPLARQLAMWLAGFGGPVDDLRFGTVAVTGTDTLAVFLVGDVTLRVDRDVVISGADAASWTDRLLPRPDGPLVLGLTDDAPAPAGVFDLHAGVVPGSAVTLLATGDHPPVVAAVSAPPEPAPPPPAIPPARPAPPAPPVRSATRPAPPVRSALIHGAADAPPPRRPLANPTAVVPSGAGPNRAAPTGVVPTAAESTAALPDDDATETPHARGHLCSRGHLNDPRSHFCVLCGIRMNERTGVLVVGPRPPLGLLVLDTGATFTLDAGYLVGRMPDADERVRSGELRGITVPDRVGAVSRAHAEIRIDGWDVFVVDNDSSNGTSVAPRGQDWVPLVPQEPRRLEPGTRVQLGDAVLTFETPSGVR